MLKKQKQLIIGFLLGASLFSIVPVGATIQGYLLNKSEVKVMVDGKEFANKELPVLIYKGYNYVPAATFREITDTLGIGFEYVGAKKEIQIDTSKKITSDNLGTKNMMDTKRDGYNLVKVDEVEYIRVSEIQDRHLDQGYSIDYTPRTQDYFFYRTNNSLQQDNQIEILQHNIPIKVFLDRAYVKYDYFKENLLPLIK